MRLAARALVGAFNGAPTLLLIVVLNLAAIGAAAFYLVRQDEHRQVVNAELIALLRSCISHGITPPAAY